ncbi:MAG: zf-HC2 domain-containing protein [Candidatus Aminicenantes bacterium]|nr:zf-HC2 domain-containing protein [Candidatus Aminicenantes bacterium]
MDCNKFEELLSAYQDNSLSPDEKKEFTDHMKLCRDCEAITEEVDHIKAILPELNRDVPFFLKNRLYLIGEADEEQAPVRNYAYLKWVAAGIGTMVLFLNLFYFTNIFPAANKTLHTAVAGVENFVVEAEAFIGRIKESNNLFIFKKTEVITKANKKKRDAKAKRKTIRGFKYG